MSDIIVDPTVYPSMTINGFLVEQIGTIPSDDGIGPPIIRTVVRDHNATGHSGQSGGDIGGLPIIWGGIGVSMPTLVRKQLHDRFSRITMNPVDRGILKSAVGVVVAAQTALNTASSNLAAAALTDAMATVAGTRVPLAAFQASAHAAAIVPLVQGLVQNSFALANAVFPLGTVAIGQDSGSPLLNQATIFDRIDADHALGLGGIYGTASSVSAAGTFCTAYQSIAERNHVAMTTTYGPVQSRYVYHPGDAGANFPGGPSDATGKVMTLDIVTFLLPSGPSTTVCYVSVHGGDN
jgi:hypothetical protein